MHRSILKTKGPIRKKGEKESTKKKVFGRRGREGDEREKNFTLFPAEVKNKVEKERPPKGLSLCQGGGKKKMDCPCSQRKDRKNLGRWPSRKKGKGGEASLFPKIGVLEVGEKKKTRGTEE